MVLLAGASVAALASSAADAASFAFTGSAQSYFVAQTGLYDLRAYGAQGGSTANAAGGKGAGIGGRINLIAGTTLQIVVGGQGGSGGGGGGTFIFENLATPLAIASGGGGAWNTLPGSPGSTGPSGTSGYTLGGSNGSGGDGGPPFNTGGGGAGFLSNGGIAPGPLSGHGGTGAAGGFAGGAGFNGANGGFGGGGGGGAGGQYGGGGAGSGFLYSGGGGGSFLAATATDPVYELGVNLGDGSATIDLFAVPAVTEPSSWAMLITGFGGIGAMLRRRRLRTA